MLLSDILECENNPVLHMFEFSCSVKFVFFMCSCVCIMRLILRLCTKLYYVLSLSDTSHTHDCTCMSYSAFIIMLYCVQESDTIVIDKRLSVGSYKAPRLSTIQYK